MNQMKKHRSRQANRFFFEIIIERIKREEIEKLKFCLRLPLNNQAFHKHADVLLADLWKLMHFHPLNLDRNLNGYFCNEHKAFSKSSKIAHSCQ